MTTKSKNFDLSEEDFLELKAQLQVGNEALFEHIFKQHLPRCKSYLVQRCGASEADADDVSLETLWRFRASLIKDKLRYGNLGFAFTLFAKRLYVVWKKNKWQSLDHIVLDGDFDATEENEDKIPVFEIADVVDVETDEDVLLAVKKALLVIDKLCRNLLVANYVDEVKLKDSFGRLGFSSYDAARMHLSRCRKAFKKLFHTQYKD